MDYIYDIGRHNYLVDRSIEAIDTASFAKSMADLGVEEMSAEYDEEADLIVPVVGLQDCLAATFSFWGAPTAEEILCVVPAMFEMEAFQTLRGLRPNGVSGSIARAQSAGLTSEGPF